ncbi:hypothetical protein OPV22_023234 [Ensete ventricosum]|uniref:Uncharacterized protein n=1 Tax=Ensete ventricosum TaxID=4639 RepID=A0AAV8QSG8_ENSVE|nr:hypothetical protein OPV22_023234 [Ensete ventricosum]
MGNHKGQFTASMPMSGLVGAGSSIILRLCLGQERCGYLYVVRGQKKWQRHQKRDRKLQIKSRKLVGAITYSHFYAFLAEKKKLGYAPSCFSDPNLRQSNFGPIPCPGRRREGSSFQAPSEWIEIGLSAAQGKLCHISS